MVRYGMLIDLRSCIGCRSCMTACKCNHDIPVGEFEGREYYRIWPMEVELGTYPYVVRNTTPLLCMQCTVPPCVDACPVEAIYKRDDGIILVDEDKCDGCKKCLSSCPYDAIYFRGDKGVVDKCTFCFELVDQGLQPECVTTCIGDAMFFGDLDDSESTISKLIKSLDAKNLFPEYRTKPAVYYSAHAGRLKGTVWDLKTQHPVGDATIMVEDLDAGEMFTTTSSVDGIFFFWKLNVQRIYHLRIEAKGYLPKKIIKNLVEEYTDLGKIDITQE